MPGAVTPNPSTASLRADMTSTPQIVGLYHRLEILMLRAPMKRSSRPITFRAAVHRRETRPDKPRNAHVHAPRTSTTGLLSGPTAPPRDSPIGHLSP